MHKALSIIIIFFSFCCYAQDYITGEQYKNASEGSVDVVASHLLLFQAQAQHNKVLNSISLTDRIAPAKLLMNNGYILSGNIQRILTNINVGFGSVKKFGMFAGIQGDYTHAGSKQQQGFSSGNSQILLYFGMSLLGFQVDAGSLLSSQGVEDLDNNFDFISDSSQMTKSNKEPPSLANYSIYHKSGIFFSATYSKERRNGVERNVLSEYKFNVQPLKEIFPKPFGLPFMELVSYTPISPYFKQYNEFYDKTFQSDSSSSNRTYDLSPGSDGVLKKGVRSSVTFQVYPKFSFKKAELAYNFYRREKSQVFGARTQLFVKNNKPNLSVDAFLLLSTISKKATISLSYSYNSPDNSTFIPLPKLHVFGIQAIFGQRETAKNIIPYATAILTHNSSKENNRNENDHYSKGIDELFNQNYKKAISEFSEAIEQDHNNAKAYFYRGIARIALDSGSPKDFKLKSKIDTFTVYVYHPQIHNWRKSNLFVRLNFRSEFMKKDGALGANDLQEAVKINPELYDAYILTGLTSISIDKVKDGHDIIHALSGKLKDNSTVRYQTKFETISENDSWFVKLRKAVSKRFFNKKNTIGGQQLIDKIEHEL